MHWFPLAPVAQAPAVKDSGVFAPWLCAQEAVLLTGACRLGTELHTDWNLTCRGRDSHANRLHKEEGWPPWSPLVACAAQLPSVQEGMLHSSRAVELAVLQRLALGHHQ